MVFLKFFSGDKKREISLKFKHYATVYVVLLLTMLGVLFGFQLGKQQSQKVSQGLESSSTASADEGKVNNKEAQLGISKQYLKEAVDFGLYWTVWNIVRDTYIDSKIPETQLFYGSLRGMVNALDDPYSVFLTPDVTSQFQSDLSGKFEGIGAEIAVKNNVLLIVAPLSDTPAAKAGLRAGDMVLKIDDKETKDMLVDEAVGLIRGVKGSKVTLKIFREGWKEAKDFVLTRDTIQVGSVKWERLDKDDLGRITISHFNENTLNLWNQAITVLTQKPLKGIILDLRNNPGGFLDTAIDIASDWIPDGIVVSEQTRSGEKVDFPAHGTARLKDTPTIVLINQGSASASEIVSGALQDYQKARLVGKVSFGKGSVQDYQVLPGGSSLKITVAKWLTPKGRKIDKQGIMPDVEVEFTEEDFNKNEDPQFDVAKKMLLDSKYVYQKPVKDDKSATDAPTLKP